MGTIKRVIFWECKPTYAGAGLYIIEFSDGGVKIGIASKLCDRVSYYNSPWIKPITRIKSYRHYNPGQLESQIKKNFKNYKVNFSTEFFTGNIFDKIIEYIEENELFYKNVPDKFRRK